MLNNTASLIIIVYYLRCSPLYRYLSSMGHIIVFILQVPGHAKVCNLKRKYYYFFIIPFSITTSPYMSPDFPPGCSWQQGLCVQSSSWTGTPYLKQSDDSTPAPVEVVLMGPVSLDYSCKEISINTTLALDLVNVSTHTGLRVWRYWLKSPFFIISITIIICNTKITKLFCNECMYHQYILILYISIYSST